MKSTAYKLTLRRKDNGDEHHRLIFAPDETMARTLAIERAKLALGPTVDAQFEVLSCVVVTPAVGPAPDTPGNPTN